MTTGRPQEYDSRITIRENLSVIEKMDKIAAQEGVDRSTKIRQLISEFINDAESDAPKPKKSKKRNV